jgi:transcriptional regulator with XRE-family HTH domain
MTPLKQIRTQRRLTIYDVAAGVQCSPGTISRVESGNHGVSPALAERLVKFFAGGLTEEQVLYPDRFVIKKTA